jgi:hypothetical protein
MTLVASGQISLYDGANPTRSVLTELQVANVGRGLPIAMSDADVKALAGAGSNAYSMSAFYGKSSFSSLLRTYTSGSGTDTVPNGAHTVAIEVWGAGGGGGKANLLGASGGGGGSSGYSSSSYSVTAGQTISYSVAGGAASGSSGGASTATSGSLSITTMTANGGAGGAIPGGGAGGTASGGNQANTTGSPGTNGTAGPPEPGGDGGGAVSGIYAGPAGAGASGAPSGVANGNTGPTSQGGLVSFYYHS